MSKCPQCGKDVPFDDAKFCPFCSTQLRVDPPKLEKVNKIQLNQDDYLIVRSSEKYWKCKFCEGITPTEYQTCQHCKAERKEIPRTETSVYSLSNKDEKKKKRKSFFSRKKKTTDEEEEKKPRKKIKASPMMIKIMFIVIGFGMLLMTGYVEGFGEYATLAFGLGGVMMIVIGFKTSSRNKKKKEKNGW